MQFKQKGGNEKRAQQVDRCCSFTAKREPAQVNVNNADYLSTKKFLLPPSKKGRLLLI
jgi:hypothetical protein